VNFILQAICCCRVTCFQQQSLLDRLEVVVWNGVQVCLDKKQFLFNYRVVHHRGLTKGNFSAMTPLSGLSKLTYNCGKVNRVEASVCLPAWTDFCVSYELKDSLVLELWVVYWVGKTWGSLRRFFCYELLDSRLCRCPRQNRVMSILRLVCLHICHVVLLPAFEGRFCLDNLVIFEKRFVVDQCKQLQHVSVFQNGGLAWLERRQPSAFVVQLFGSNALRRWVERFLLEVRKDHLTVV